MKKTAMQRACEAVSYWQEEQSRSLQRRGGRHNKTGEGDTREILAKRFDVSATYVQAARNLLLNDPERFEEVANGGPIKSPIPLVYAIGTGLSPTKIGRSVDLYSRVSTLQTGYPYKLKVLASIEVKDSHKLESKIHNLLSVRRLEGEWFDIDGEEIVELFNILEEKT